MSTAAPDPGPPGEVGPEPTLKRLGWKEVVQSLLGFAFAFALLYYGLPRIAETTWPDIGRQLATVDLWWSLLMMALMLIGLYCYTFTLIGALPGLTHTRALMVNAAGSMVSNILPGGGAVGVALSYVMFRSWSFSRKNISIALVVTGVWNLLARLLLPVLGTLIVVFGPVDAPQRVIIASSIAGAITVAVIVAFVVAIYSDSFSHRLGHGLTRALRPFSRKIREGVDVDDLIQDQRARLSTVVRKSFWPMTLGIVGMFGFFYILYVVAARTVGLDLSLAHLFAAYTFRQFLTIVAITPGGLGVTEAGTAGVLVAFGGDPAAAASAALLYAIFTHVLEVPLGVVAWAAWWFSPKHRDAPEGQIAEDLAAGADPDPPRPPQAGDGSKSG